MSDYRYWVTSTLNNHTLDFRKPIEDPFIRHTVRIGWLDLLKALVAGHGLIVTVSVGGDTEAVDAVLGLDGDSDG